MDIKDVGVRRRLRRIKALVLDVDGVLTDGGMYYSARGEEMKKFNTKDGMGIALLRDAGLLVALITGETAEIVLRRAEKLEIEEVYLGADDKLAALRDFVEKHKISLEEVAYAGDDVNDLSCLHAAGVAFSVADASPVAKKAAELVTVARGGEGAVREICDVLLSHRSG